MWEDFWAAAQPFNIFLLKIPRDISFTLFFIDVLNESKYVIHILYLGLQNRQLWARKFRSGWKFAIIC